MSRVSHCSHKSKSTQFEQWYRMPRIGFVPQALQETPPKTVSANEDLDRYDEHTLLVSFDLLQSSKVNSADFDCLWEHRQVTHCPRYGKCDYFYELPSIYVKYCVSTPLCRS